MASLVNGSNTGNTTNISLSQNNSRASSYLKAISTSMNAQQAAERNQQRKQSIEQQYTNLYNYKVSMQPAIDAYNDKVNSIVNSYAKQMLASFSEDSVVDAMERDSLSSMISEGLGLDKTMVSSNLSGIIKDMTGIDINGQGAWAKFRDAYSVWDIQEEMNSLAIKLIHADEGSEYYNDLLTQIRELQAEAINKSTDWGDVKRNRVSKYLIEQAAFIHQQLENGARSWIPTIGGAVLGGVVAGPSGAATGWRVGGLAGATNAVADTFVNETGGAILSMMDLRDNEGNAMSQETIRKAAYGYGLIATIIEFGDDLLEKTVVGDAVGMAKNAALAIAKEVLPSFLTSTAGQLVLASLGNTFSESFEEFLQGGFETFITEMAKSASNRSGDTYFDNVNFIEKLRLALEDGAESFKQSVPSMLLISPLSVLGSYGGSRLVMKNASSDKSNELFTTDGLFQDIRNFNDNGATPDANTYKRLEDAMSAEGSKLEPIPAKFDENTKKWTPVSPEDQKLVSLMKSKGIKGIRFTSFNVESENIANSNPSRSEMLALKDYLSEELGDGIVGTKDVTMYVKDQAALDSVIETLDAQGMRYEQKNNGINVFGYGKDGKSYAYRVSIADYLTRDLDFTYTPVISRDTTGWSQERIDREMAIEESFNRIKSAYPDISDTIAYNGAMAMQFLAQSMGKSAKDILDGGMIMFHMASDDEVSQKRLNMKMGASNIIRGWQETKTEDGKTVYHISLTKDADERTLAHEIGHVIRKSATAEQLSGFIGLEGYTGEAGAMWSTDIREENGKFYLGSQEFDTFYDAMKSIRSNEEKFVDDFLHYVETGEAPNEKLKGLFERMKDFIRQIMSNLKGEISAEAKAAFDKFFTTERTSDTAGSDAGTLMDSWREHDRHISERVQDDWDAVEAMIRQNPEKYYDSEGNLLAPNGKKSNLTYDQYIAVRTAAFKAWFGDWENDPENASKVVDRNGEPLVMYHGTFTWNDFDTFDLNRTGDNWNGYASHGKGIYFTSSEDKAFEWVKRAAKKRNDLKWDYGATIKEEFLNIRNPYTGFMSQLDMSAHKSLTDYGYDGYFDDAYHTGEYLAVATNANQIKSATENNGEYSRENDNTLFEIGWHGSGVAFDHFMDEFIGTGEGRQAFGYGHYIAGAPLIGKGYADASGAKFSVQRKKDLIAMREREVGDALSSIAYNEQRIRDLNDTSSAEYKKLKDHYDRLAEYHPGMLKGRSFEQHLEYTIHQLERSIGMDKTSLDLARRDLEKLPDMPTTKSTLYRVEIPDDGYLDWDKTPSMEDFRKISKALQQRLDDDLNGENISDYGFGKRPESSFGQYYGSIAVALGSDKEATRFLLGLGYRGIVYDAAQAIPANMAPEGAIGARNHVMFDSRDIIKQKMWQYDGEEDYKAQAGEGGILFDSSIVNPLKPESFDDEINDIFTNRGKSPYNRIVISKSNDFYRSIGLNGENFTVKRGSITRHSSKEGHFSSANDWIALANSFHRPIGYFIDDENKFHIYFDVRNNKGETMMALVEERQTGRTSSTNLTVTAFFKRNFDRDVANGLIKKINQPSVQGHQSSSVLPTSVDSNQMIDSKYGEVNGLSRDNLNKSEEGGILLDSEDVKDLRDAINNINISIEARHTELSLFGRELTRDQRIQRAFQNAYSKVYLNPDGSNKLLKLAGITPVDYSQTMLLGTFQGKTNVNETESINLGDVKAWKGSDGRPYLDNDTFDKINAVYKVKTILQRQEGTSWHIPFVVNDPKLENCYEIHLADNLTAEDDNFLQNTITAELKAYADELEAAGDTEKAGRLRDAAAYGQISTIAIPNGVRIIDFNYGGRSGKDSFFAFEDHVEYGKFLEDRVLSKWKKESVSEPIRIATDGSYIDASGIWKGMDNDSEWKSELEKSLSNEFERDLYGRSYRSFFKAIQSIDKITLQELGISPSGWSEYTNQDGQTVNGKNYYPIPAPLDGKVDIFASDQGLEYYTAEELDSIDFDPNRGIVRFDLDPEYRISTRVSNLVTLDENGNPAISSAIPKGQSFKSLRYAPFANVSGRASTQIDKAASNIQKNRPKDPGFWLRQKAGESSFDYLMRVEDELVKNLSELYDRLASSKNGKALVKQGMIWYDTDHAIGKNLYENHKGLVFNGQELTELKTDAIVAGYSPSRDWNLNVVDAVLTLDIVRYLQDKTPTAEMVEYANGAMGNARMSDEDLASYATTRFKDMTIDQQASFISGVMDKYVVKHYREIVPGEGLGEYVKTKTGAETVYKSAGRNEILRALRLLRGEESRELYSTLSRAQKVLSFFNNGAYPNSLRMEVTADSHAVQAALLRAIGSGSWFASGATFAQDEDTGTSFLAGIIADSYRRLAFDKGILPQQAQAIVWGPAALLLNSKSAKLMNAINAINEANNSENPSAGDIIRKETFKLMDFDSLSPLSSTSETREGKVYDKILGEGSIWDGVEFDDNTSRLPNVMEYAEQSYSNTMDTIGKFYSGEATREPMMSADDAKGDYLLFDSEVVELEQLDNRKRDLITPYGNDIKKALELGEYISDEYLRYFSDQDWAANELAVRTMLEQNPDIFDDATSYSSLEKWLQDSDAFKDTEISDEQKKTLSAAFEAAHRNTPEQLDRIFADEWTVSDEKMLELAGKLSDPKTVKKMGGFSFFKGMSTKVLNLKTNDVQTGNGKTVKRSTHAQIEQAKRMVQDNPRAYRLALEKIEGKDKTSERIKGSNVISNLNEKLNRFFGSINAQIADIRSRQSASGEAAVATEAENDATIQRADEDLAELEKEGEVNEADVRAKLDDMNEKYEAQKAVLDSIREQVSRLEAKDNADQERVTAARNRAQKAEKRLGELRKERDKYKNALNALQRRNRAQAEKEQKVKTIKKILKNVKYNTNTIDASFEDLFAWVRGLFDKIDREELYDTRSELLSEISARKAAGEITDDLETQLEEVRQKIKASEMVEIPGAARVYFNDMMLQKADNRQSAWTVEELEYLHQRVTLMRQDAKAMLDRKFQQRSQERSDMANGFFEENYGRQPVGFIREDVRNFPSKDDNTSELGKKLGLIFKIANATPGRAARFVDGQKEGVAYDLFRRKAWNAGNEEQSAVIRRVEAGVAKFKELGMSAAKLNRKGYTVKKANGDTVNLTRDEMIGVYIYTKSDLGAEKVMSTIGNGISRETCIDIIRNLSAEERAWGDFLLQEMGGNYSRIADVFYSEYNQILGRRDHYFPFVASGKNMEGEGDILAGPTQQKVRYTDKGFTKSVNPHAIYALQLNVTQTWLNQVKRQEHFIAFAKWTRDANYLLGRGGMGDVIRQKYGQSYLDNLQDYVNFVGSPQSQMDSIDRVFSTLMGSYGASKVIGNLGAMLKQLPTIAAAIQGDVDVKNFFKSVIAPKVSLNNFLRANAMLDPNSPGYRNFRQFIYDNDANMKNRRLGSYVMGGLNDVGMSEFGTAKDKMNSFIGKHTLSATDGFVTQRLWLACYMTTMENLEKEAQSNGVAFDANEASKEAAFKAAQLISETQNTAVRMDLSQNLRKGASGSLYHKMMFMFGSATMNVYNMMFYDIPFFSSNKKVGKAIGTAAFVGINIAAMMAISGAFLRKDDEDDDEYARRLVAEAAGQVINDVIPGIGGEISNAMQGYSGSGTMTLFEDAGTILKDAGTMAVSEEKRWEAFADIMSTLVKTGAGAAGIGATGAEKIGKAVINANPGYMMNKRWADWYEENFK